MEELATIHQVCAELAVTSRALRYWESAGLFRSSRDSSSGWRQYDADALQRIRITMLLRELDIPVRHIKQVLDQRSAAAIAAVLESQLNRLDKLDRENRSKAVLIRSLLLLVRDHPPVTLASLETMLSPIPGRSTPEATLFMTAIDTIIGNIQIIEMEPTRTAAHSLVGVEPEEAAAAPVLQWMREQNLTGTMRLFGFNVDPYPTEENPAYGFGYCATVPESVEIPAPLYQLRLPGGLYGKLDVPAGNDPTHGWKQISQLLSSGRWEWDFDQGRGPALEEHIPKGDAPGYLFSLLIPVSKK